MVSLEILRKHGVTQERLQMMLAGDPLGLDPAKSMVNQSDPQELKDDKARVASLLRRVRSRVQEGMNRNFADFKLYNALDVAWDTPFRQTTETMLQQLMDKNPNEEEVYKAFQAHGLTHLICERVDPKDRTKKVRELNAPIFFKVFVPLVQAYVKIRWAKIMNDRRLTPFFEYVPAKLSADMMAKCAAITDRVQVMSNQYGYYDVQKQAVMKMLHYGLCIQFIKEAWHSEEQVRYATPQDIALKKPTTQPAPDAPNDNGTESGTDETPEESAGTTDNPVSPAPAKPAVKLGDEIIVTVREGLRYHQPHPTRTFTDLSHPNYTINYDSGCEFMGYWRIERYRTLEQSTFWNKDRIALGTIDLVSQNPIFFQSVYAACTLRLPVQVAPSPVADGTAGAFGVGAGGGTLDREKHLAQLYYGSEHGDQGVLITEYFEKLKPKDWGLGNYEHPVWFRFCIAGDGCTVLFAEPLPYTPAVYYGYDEDGNRTKNASMSLEILPFQDHFSNVLSQIILTAKQNLANIVFVDEAQVEVGFIDKVRNIGEAMFRKLNIFTFDSKKAAKYQNKIAEAVQTFKFPQGNTSELTTVLKTILDVLERVLVMSSNEVGQAASHEQTKEEIRNIAANTSSRLVFTTTPVDIAAEAQKRQIYAGLMNYGDQDIYVHIPADSILTKDVLQSMGFTYVDNSVKTEGTSQRMYSKYHVRLNAVAVDLWEFASTRDQQDRVQNDKIAVALAQLFGEIMGNPITAQAVGAQQAIDWANEIAYFSGMPRDFKLRAVGGDTTPQQQQQDAQNQLSQLSQSILAQVNAGLKQELQPLLGEVSQNSSDIALIMKALKVDAPHPANDTDQSQIPVGTQS